MIDETTAVLRSWRKKFTRVSGRVVRRVFFRKGKKQSKGNGGLQISVRPETFVHVNHAKGGSASSLRRKRASDDLRGESLRSLSRGECVGESNGSGDPRDDGAVAGHLPEDDGVAIGVIDGSPGLEDLYRGSQAGVIPEESHQHVGNTDDTINAAESTHESQEAEDLLETSRRSSDVGEEAPASAESTHGNEARQEHEQCHALGYPPDAEIQEVHYGVVLRPNRPRQRPRPRGLVLDADAMANLEGLDMAVSPTNTNVPFQVPREMRSPLLTGVGGCGFSLDHLKRISRASLSHRRSTVASSFIESQERFDSYVDAINDADAKRCSMHAVLSTDIARLVAELDVLHIHIAMANMRAAYHRRSALGIDGRPESWAMGSRKPAHKCSCGRPSEPKPRQQSNVKRQTWHAGQTPAQRRRSRESETEQDVMVRNSAGIILFRRSAYGMPQERGRSLDRGTERPAPPRVELNKSFDFRRECERLARRIRPTFAVFEGRRA